MPSWGEPLARGEIISIVFSSEGTTAWKNEGEKWEPVSSWIVYQTEDEIRKHLVIVSVYAPMFHSPQQDKDDFYAGLQRVIDQVSEQDILVVMGDWNARVGSSQEGQLGPPCLKTNLSPTLLLRAWRTGLAVQKHGLAPGSTLMVALYPSSVLKCWFELVCVAVQHTHKGFALRWWDCFCINVLPLSYGNDAKTISCIRWRWTPWCHVQPTWGYSKKTTQVQVTQCVHLKQLPSAK